MHKYCLFNDTIKRVDEPILKPNDLAVFRGYGIFDFMPVKNSIPVFYEDYWKRFSRSAGFMSLALPYPAGEMRRLLGELFRKNDLTDGYCRMVLTGGYSSNGFTPDGPPNLIITTSGPVHNPEEHYTRGIKLLSVDYVRDLPEIKSLNYSRVLKEQTKLKAAGALDVLYAFKGKISESSRANFFIIGDDGVLKTPETNILRGITRGKILEIAETASGAKTEDFGMPEALKAQGAFLTSTTKDLIPVTRIDDGIIGGGKIHPLIGEMRSAFQQRVARYVKENS